MYERNPRQHTRNCWNFLRLFNTSCVGFHDLTTKGFMNFIHGGFEAGSPTFREKVFARHVSLDFDHFVVSIFTLFHAQKNLASLEVPIEGQQLLELVGDKVQQRLIGIKMDGMNLYLHRSRGLVPLRISMVQRRSFMKLLQLCCRVLRVHLRGGQTGMSEQVLDRGQFSASVE